MAEFGRVIRRRRVAAGLGQEEFAEQAGMHRTTCSLIERGRQSPTMVMLAQIAKALGTTMASLVAEVEEVDSPSADPPRLPSGRKWKKK